MTDRMPCQVCGRTLAVRRDGTTKPHNARSRNGHHCQGSRYRHARWPVGQQLVHHAGSVWEVVADLGAWGGAYRLRLVSNPPGDWRTPEGEPGMVRTFHGEYMHRDGWRGAIIVASSRTDASTKVDNG